MWTTMEVVDIADLLAYADVGSCGCQIGHPELLRKLAQLKTALTSCGFLLVTGHGIPTQLTSNAMTDALQFFGNTTDYKMMRQSKDRARRGFSPTSSENFASLVGVRGADNDLVEKYRIGPIVSNETKSLCPEYYDTKNGRIHFFENNAADLQTDLAGLVPYYQAVERFAQRLLKLVFMSVDAGTDALDALVDKHTSILSANYYNPLADSGVEQLRVAGHTDVSLLTIVAQSSCSSGQSGGLEVLLRNEYGEDRFVPVPYIENALIVNVGDCLQYWSKGMFRSAMHRVVTRRTASAELDARLSLAFFYAPNYDAVLAWPKDSTDGSEETGLTDYTTWRKNHIKQAMAQLKKG